MRYRVEVNGELVDVEIEPGGITVDGERVHAHLSQVGVSPLHVLLMGEAIYRVAVQKLDGWGRYLLWTDSHRYQVEALDERKRTIREMAGKGAVSPGPAPLVAPMPGLVVRVNIATGDAVVAGQGLIVMEAMKMENELRATSAGTVSRVLVTAGVAVEKGALLVELV